jgi:hypothetical protein
MKNSFIGLLTLATMSQAFAFGIQIDTQKRPSIKDSSEYSFFSTERDEQWVGAIAEGLSLDKYLPKLGSPVHESITMEALRGANLGQNESWTDNNNIQIYGSDEVLTGLLWNDDPDGYLFPKSPMNPKGFDKHLNGVQWLLKFVELEFFIRKRASAIEKKPGLLKAQKQLSQQIKSFKPMSVSAWNIYDSMVYRFNSVNSDLKDIEKIELEYNVGDVDEMAKVEKKLVITQRAIEHANKNIKNPNLALKEFRKYQRKGKSRSTDKVGLDKAINRYITSQEAIKKKLNGKKNSLKRLLQDLKQFSAVKNNIMYASHFGDLQYLHSMGSSQQTRDQVKKKIMSYISHAWRTASGELPFKEQRKKIAKVQREYRESGKYSTSFKNRFSMADLLYHTKDKEGIRYRALGSVLHLVQDSYAKGHTVRENWEINRGDGNLDQANSGKIRFFQDYSGQGAGEESHADHDTNMDNQANFKDIPGAKMAIKRSTQLVKFFMKKCTWENLNKNNDCPKNGVKDYIDNTIFALVAEVEPGKIQLDHDHNRKESSKTRAHPKFVPSNK